MSAYRVTFRSGPRVEHERLETLDDALIAIEARVRTTGAPQRDTRSFLGRDFEPGEQVALRAELKGPRGLRAGIDLRGDGSAVPWTGRIGRRAVDVEPGEDVHVALRRALT